MGRKYRSILPQGRCALSLTTHADKSQERPVFSGQSPPQSEAETGSQRNRHRVMPTTQQPFPSSGDLPNPQIEPWSPTLQADSLPAEPQGKPKNIGVGSLFSSPGKAGISGLHSRLPRGVRPRLEGKPRHGPLSKAPPCSRKRMEI